jgi:hypothetical protein
VVAEATTPRSRSNIKGFDDGTKTPGIEVQRLGQQAPLSSLLTLHRATLAERTSFGARVLPVHTAADVLASGQRLHAFRAAHMAHIGYFDPQAEAARLRDRLTADALRLLLAELKSIHDSTSPPPRNTTPS